MWFFAYRAALDVLGGAGDFDCSGPCFFIRFLEFRRNRIFHCNGCGRDNSGVVDPSCQKRKLTTQSTADAGKLALARAGDRER